eukprot:765784-Hanusia_phi.AAC.4
MTARELPREGRTDRWSLRRCRRKLIALGQVRLWDLRQQASSRVLACPGEEVLSLHFNPSETMLAAGFASETLPPPLSHSSFSFSCSSRNSFPLSSPHLVADSCCNVWELRMGKVMHRFQHHQHQCRSVEYSPDGRWLVTASFDGKTNKWTGHIQPFVAYPPSATCTPWKPIECNRYGSVLVFFDDEH